MRYPRPILACLLLLTVAACGGHSAVPAATNVPLLPLFGSNVDGVSVKSVSSSLDVTISPATTPRFFRRDLPAGTVPQSWTWSGQTDAALTLAVPANGDLEVAVIPLDRSTAATLSLAVVTGPTSPV